MAQFLRNFDRLSFWLGFLAASLLWFLVSRSLPALKRFFANLQANMQASRQEHSQSDEIRLNNDTLRYAQRWHLTAPLFSLDEIAIQPRLLAPPIAPMAYEPPPSEDVTDWAIPNLPDWPELASHYGAPWLSLPEALLGGAHLAVTGQPGAGKTTALAYLAVQLIRQRNLPAGLEHLTPLLIHAADLTLPAPDPKNPLGPLLAALSSYVVSIPEKRRAAFLSNLMIGGRPLLLVDGLDEFSPGQLAPIVDYLGQLLGQYKSLRLVVAAHPNQIDGLGQLGLQSLPLVAWGSGQRALYISRWSDLWNRYIAPAGGKSGPAALDVDPLLVIGWLLTNTEFLNPLELTLKVWGAFAGDSLGPTPLAAIEAYLRRMMAGQPEKNRKALEQMAAQMILTLQPVVNRDSAANWLGGAEAMPAEQQTVDEDENGAKKEKGAARPVRARGAINDLLDSGLVMAHANGQVRIAHPALAGYLAAQALAPQHTGAPLAAQPEWAARSAALGYLVVMDSQPAWLEEWIQDERQDVLLHGLLTSGRWLRLAPDSQPWVQNVLRRLVSVLQKEELPLAIHARAALALTLSGNANIPTLLRQMLVAPRAELRQMAGLGLGMLRETKAVGEVINLLSDSTPAVSRAAILSLVAMNDKNGLEAVAGMLLAGDDSQRRAAAEALANHAEEGHPTLEEGSRLEDASVRRAVVYGLGRTRQPWAIKILEELRAKDAQWVVQDAASQVLTSLQDSNPRLPRPLPTLPQTAWLLTFAADRGMAVAPGKPAYEMLHRAMKEGDEDQRLAAMYFLGQQGDEASVLPLYKAYFSERGELRERAWDALWGVGAAGIPLPPPAQFDLR